MVVLGEPTAASGPWLSWVHSRLEFLDVSVLQYLHSRFHPPDTGVGLGSLKAAVDPLTTAAPCGPQDSPKELSVSL